MEIILVRHGESETNVTKTLSNPQTPLTNNGLKQAEKLAARLSNLRIDLILSSDYRRAMQTAEIINSACKTSLETDPLLREKTVPSELQGQSETSLEHKKYVKELLLNINDPNWHYSDEENVFDVLERSKKLMRKLQNLDKNIETVLCVSHTGFIKNLMSVIMLDDLWQPELGRKVYDFLKHGNTAISRLNINESGKFKLLNWNDEAHLAE